MFEFIAEYQMELDDFAQKIAKKLLANGAENQNISVEVPSFLSLSPADCRYLERKIEEILSRS